MEQEKTEELIVEATSAPTPKAKKSAGRRILDIVSTVCVAIVVLAAVLLVGLRLFGLGAYTVLSGSMEPTYYTGDLIFVKKVTPSEELMGKPITFILNDSGTVATHRVVGITKDENGALYFQTKGDNNQTADGGKGVHEKNIIGTPIFRIPLLGYVSDFVQNRPGSYVTIAVVAILLIAVFLPDIFKIGKTSTPTDSPVPDAPSDSADQSEPKE